MTRRFASGKEAMDYLFGRDSGPGSKLDREIADALANPDPAKVAAYQERLEAKRDRLEERARKASAQAQLSFGAANRITEGIPMGQPILVGHHSERRHRRDLERRDRSMRKGFELSDQAEGLRAAAKAVGTGGISSDDPEAVKKLRKELAGLQAAQEKMKAANVAIRKHARQGEAAQVPALVALGFDEAQARKLLQKDFAGRIGFPNYALTNGNASIRRVEKRIEELVEKAKTPEREMITGEIGGMRFELAENKDANRVQISFAGKPDDALRSKLKRAGFKWAPSIGVWQRHISNQAWYQAKHVLGIGP